MFLYTYNCFGIALNRLKVVICFKIYISLFFPVASSVLVIIYFLIFCIIFIKACLLVIELASSVSILGLDIVLLLIVGELHGLVLE
jgi:hypothetical protein